MKRFYLRSKTIRDRNYNGDLENDYALSIIEVEEMLNKLYLENLELKARLQNKDEIIKDLKEDLAIEKEADAI